MEKRKKGGVYIDPFMFEDLDLEDSELLTYAIIYGFTVHGSAGEFTATLEYLMHRTKKGKPATIAILQRLMEKGLLTRRKLPKGKSYAYRAIVPQKRREEPEEVVTDDEVRNGIESLYTDDETEGNMVASNNHDGCFNEPCVVASVNHDGCVGQPINKKEIKGEINNEIKKETLKKKVSNNPYVQTLFDLGFLDDDDILPCENLFFNYMGSPQERFDMAFREFTEAFKEGEAQYGVPYLTKFMKERLNNENDHDTHTGRRL